ncbi:MAG: 4-hydroxythreonine-4-phosphate dehydrogenase PdxA [Saprospiraceae bacterium]|nr:4-hydroxythreonine-4-phosphate dehydrogenase PdxA [Saprospiraceae bacterium]
MKIGITIGDVNGIGPEVIIKALTDERILDHFTPIIYGSSKVMSYHKNIVKESTMQFHHISEANRAAQKKINVLNCWEDNVNISLGKVTEEGGRYAKLAIEKAAQDLKAGLIDGLVTAPINKAAMKLANFGHAGHTEYFETIFGSQGLMLMVSDHLRVGLVTNHLPISEVTAAITKERILKKIKVFEESLRVDFGVDKPTIAVLGLNPHAGDEGAIGDQEEKIIRPAVIELKKSGLMVYGPYPADGFFGSAQYKKFDGVLAMYHDQGLVALKSLSFGDGINFTAGIKGIRTSPDHGTAYDIAGLNQADPSSMRRALFLAKDLIKSRSDYYAFRVNSLDKKQRPSDSEEEDEILEDA